MPVDLNKWRLIRTQCETAWHAIKTMNADPTQKRKVGDNLLRAMRDAAELLSGYFHDVPDIQQVSPEQEIIMKVHRTLAAADNWYRGEADRPDERTLLPYLFEVITLVRHVPAAF